MLVYHSNPTSTSHIYCNCLQLEITIHINEIFSHLLSAHVLVSIREFRCEVIRAYKSCFLILWYNNLGLQISQNPIPYFSSKTSFTNNKTPI